MNEFLIPILIILLLILVNGLFVAAEFAIVSVPHTRLTQKAGDGSIIAKQLLKIVRTPELLNRYISTAQIGITIASLGLGMYGEHTVAEWLAEPLAHLGWFGTAASHTLATIISIALLTYLHVVIGEMVPKSLALQSAEQTAIRLSRPMAVAQRIFAPLTLILNRIGDWLLRIVGIPQIDPHQQLTSAEELEYIVDESYESGLLKEREQLYLENVFDFQERVVSQVMTPRTRMASLPAHADVAVIIQTISETRYSRYPIYEEDLDHVVGILHVKDFGRHLVQGKGTPLQLHEIMRPVIFVPATQPLDQMLLRFRREHVQVAVVVDEYGGTSGLVTLEDLVEEIVGEIQDEFDEEIPPFQEVQPDVVRVRGDLLLDELNQHYDLILGHGEAETVGGLAMAQLGHVVSVGETFDYRGVKFEIETVDGLAVRTVLIYLRAI